MFSGVGDPFLGQDLRYHCPVFGILKFSKPNMKSYVRNIWIYDQGDYQQLRMKAAATDWASLFHNNLNVYVSNITNHLISIAKECIPNKTVRIRPSDPPWLTCYIKRYIRKRKRAYRKAKQTNSRINWNKFKKLRNKVVSLIRESKQVHIDKISNKLKSDSLSSKNWWSILKTFISPNSKYSVPPLDHNGIVYTEEEEKVNILNNFFRDQTILPDNNSFLPDIPLYPLTSYLDSIVLSPPEVESVLKTLATAKHRD